MLHRVQPHAYTRACYVNPSLKDRGSPGGSWGVTLDLLPSESPCADLLCGLMEGSSQSPDTLPTLTWPAGSWPRACVEVAVSAF
jgi:hypothetical protein